MFTCEICSKEFDNAYKFGGHYSSHFRGEKFKIGRRKRDIVIRNENHTCKYCNQSFPNGFCLGGHIVICNKRPDYDKILKNKIFHASKTKGTISPNKKCIKCGSVGSVLTHGGRLCQECRLKSYPIYYSECLFRFNIYKYPDEFDLSLANLYGWYSPQKNIRGVSRDHIFSASKAFHLNIDPIIIRHPANCKLMIHLDNLRKSNTCNITIEELKIKILEFDKKYGVVV